MDTGGEAFRFSMTTEIPGLFKDRLRIEIFLGCGNPQSVRPGLV